MVYALFERVKGIIRDPVGTFQGSRDDTEKTVIVYFGVLLLFLAIISAIVAAITLTALNMSGIFGRTMPVFGTTFMTLMPVISFFEILIVGAVFTLIAGLWIHLWVWILGGRNGIFQTMKAFIYGVTPSLVLGWIPLASILFAIWSFILCIIGIRELAGLSTGKAALAMIIAALIPIVIAVYLFAVFFLPFMHSAMAMTPQTGY